MVPALTFLFRRGHSGGNIAIIHTVVGRGVPSDSSVVALAKAEPRLTEDGSPYLARKHTSVSFRIASTLVCGVFAGWIGAAAAKPLPVPFQAEYQIENWGIDDGYPE